MSELKVEVCNVHSIEEHPNADRLELATISDEGGWQCVVQKGVFKSGDKIVYFPIDSILPETLESKIFGPDSKVKLSNHRVRTIKLRGAISQGLAVPMDILGLNDALKVGTDLTKVLGVTKYEPPIKGSPTRGGWMAGKKQLNPNFAKYTDIQHLKKYPNVLSGQNVAITEKIHGTNFRAGWVKAHPTTLFGRVKHILKIFASKLSLVKYHGYQFVYGSRNVQLQEKYTGKDFYSQRASVDVYTKMVKQYDLKNLLKPGEVIYGEIYGDKIQKGYTYGMGPDEHGLVVFDVMNGDQYLPLTDAFTFCVDRYLDFVPILAAGKFDLVEVNQLVGGPSILHHSQKVREGIVVRPIKEEKSYMGRPVLKFINPEYLLKEQTEYH